MRYILSFVFIFFLMVSVSAQAESFGEKLFKEKCASCHDLGRSLGKKYSDKTWLSTINRMKRYGLQVSQVQAEEITNYLVNRE